MNTVLVVDANPTRRNVVARSLGDAGFSVLEAANSQEAAQLVINESEIDAAVVHGDDLPQTAADIAAIRSTLPIIVGSGSVDRYEARISRPVSVSYLQSQNQAPGVLVEELRKLLDLP